jgi:hypothetical protein
MIPRSIYSLVCILAAIFLMVTNARGLSFWLGLASGFSSRGGSGGGYSAFHHK